MQLFSTRRHAANLRATRFDQVDRIVSPIVAVLLLVGAAVILITWSIAQEAVDERAAGVNDRAQRFASVVEQMVDERLEELDELASQIRTELQPGRGALLQRELESYLDAELGHATISWLVVRADGSVEAFVEQRKGELVASGVADDLRVLGRSVATQQRSIIGGRMRIGNRTVIAVGLPIDPEVSGGRQLALVGVRDAFSNPVATFVQTGSPQADMIGTVVIVDGRGRVIVGPEEVTGGITTSHDVAGTDWSVEITIKKIATSMIGWFYPAFAGLLVMVAMLFATQSILRGRMRREHARRNDQVHNLYDLASRVLHATSIEAQAEDLARTAIQLTGADGAMVHLQTDDGVVAFTEGETGAGRAKVSIPVIGPRATLGQLIVAREGGTLDAEETWVVRTAATLAGAAIHTLASLETERAVSADLQRLDELRSNLLATVSHELLSPLTSVKGVLGLLSMQDDLGERGREYVDVATDRTDRLVALIRDLFDCSLIETGQLDIRPIRQRADVLLESSLGAQAAARSGELRLSATPNLMVTVDPVRFDQLVTNLVTNAFRHGAPPIEVSVRPTDGGVVIIVTDEGKGIPAASRDQIFDKFYQASSGHARIAEGAGLGLNLVRGLVELHGGHITIDSTHADGRGARFTVYLPDLVPGMSSIPAAAPDDVAAQSR